MTHAAQYAAPGESHVDTAIYTTVLGILRRRLPQGGRILEVGCGAGSLAASIARAGYSVLGIDPSRSGVEAAKRQGSTAEFRCDTMEGLEKELHSSFDAVVSVEVIEHCYSISSFFADQLSLLKPGGLCIHSTPYHGFVKNLLIILSGRFDHHFNPLWEGGHIKFFSKDTLSKAFEDANLSVDEFHRVGRIAPIAKSMIIVAENQGSLSQ
ncbi:MAG: methyltransferase domain-containing protein [Pseudomonadota bacterium]